MKAYEQLATIYKKDKEKLKVAFEEWCKAVGYTEEEGDKELFKIPDKIAINILLSYR